jgi:hypothetical protein
VVELALLVVDKGTQQTSVLISLFQTQADNSLTKKGGGPYEIS